MNNLLINLKIRLKTKLFGKMTWNKILQEKGISSKKINNSDYFDDIILKIFNEHFLEIEKDKTIKLEHISKTYDNSYRAVNDFNLEIKPQEFICLLGPSGCGKTTVLRMLAGFENITNGEYFMGAQSLNDTHPSERNTTMVFQNYALYPFMSVYDNIAFGLKLKTFKNNQVLKLLAKYQEINKPWVNQVKDLKYQIFLLKHPYQNKINNLHKEIKKLSFHKTKDKIAEHELKVKELNDLQNEAKILLTKNQTEINKIKSKIKKTITEQKLIQKKSQIKEKVQREKVKSQIKKLSLAAKTYFKEKKDDYNELNALLSKQKKLKKTYEKKSYGLIDQELKTIKKMAKDLNISKDEITKVKNDYQKQIEIIKHKQLSVASKTKELENKKTIIKNKNIFAINDLKNTNNPGKKIAYQIERLAIIWKYSIGARIKNIAAIAGIDKYLTRKPTELSGGQRQRVALIRAISKDAQLFLFDEPLSNLDAKLRETMRREIKKIHNSTNSTSLYVTHDQVEAMSMASKIVVMNIGFIQQVGKPIDLYDNPANIFVAKFIGSPMINLKIAKLTSLNQISMQGQRINLKLNQKRSTLIKPYLNKDILAGFRPQDVLLLPKKENNALMGKVKLVELTGSNKIVLLDSKAGEDIRITIPNNKLINPGDTIYFKIDPSKIHIFDHQNGHCISSLLNEETENARKIWIRDAKERYVNNMILDHESTNETISQKIAKSLASKISAKNKSKHQLNEIAKRSKVYDENQSLNLDS